MIMLDNTSYIYALSTLFTRMARVGHEQGSQNQNSVRIWSERLRTDIGAWRDFRRESIVISK